MRHRANTLAPPPPRPEMAESPAYCTLSASARALLVQLEIEVQVQGGLIAVVDLDDACAASGMRKPALIAALDQLMEAGFIVTGMIGKLCIVAPQTGWRRT
jgi:hypothetical protein